MRVWVCVNAGVFGYTFAPFCSCVSMRVCAYVCSMRSVLFGVAFSGIVAVYVWRRNRRQISEREFEIAITRINEAVFNKLFEFAQTAQRVVIGRSREEGVSDVLKSTALVELDRIQARILNECGLDESQLRMAQTQYPKVDAERVAKMFDAFLKGEFPVLSKQDTTLPDSELLCICELILDAKFPHTDIVEMQLAEEKFVSKVCSKTSFNNQIAQRINASDSFRFDLMDIVCKAQNKFKSVA